VVATSTTRRHAGIVAPTDAVPRRDVALAKGDPFERRSGAWLVRPVVTVMLDEGANPVGEADRSPTLGPGSTPIWPMPMGLRTPRAQTTAFAVEVDERRGLVGDRQRGAGLRVRDDATARNAPLSSMVEPTDVETVQVEVEPYAAPKTIVRCRCRSRRPVEGRPSMYSEMKRSLLSRRGRPTSWAAAAERAAAAARRLASFSGHLSSSGHGLRRSAAAQAGFHGGSHLPVRLGDRRRS
jgi:hypothetical protein